MQAGSPAYLRAVVCLFALCGIARSQATFGVIAGRVTDATGAVIPGARIRVTNQATNISRALSSDALGNYEATHLNPGLYTVAAEAAGFKKSVHREILLETLGRVRIDVRLEVGEVASEVTVTEGAPVVESETSTLSQVRSNRQLLDLPVNIIGNVAPLYQYTVLTPTANEGGGSLRSFAGGRGTQTFFNVDGISSNSIVFGNQESTLQPPVESMQEVKIEFVNNRAEFADPGNLTVLTRSGQNEFHGSAFWYHYDSALAAREFFAPTRGAVDPVTGKELHSQQNILGGSLGGRIKRDKAFFFVAYENNYDPTPAAVSVNAPTRKMREGDFSELLALARPITIRNPFTGQPLPGNRVPAELRSAASRNAQERLYPLPNFGPPELTVANFRGGFPRDRRVDKINSRVDYLFSERHTVYARFGYTRSLANELAGGFLPAGFIGGHARTLNRAPQGTISSTYTLAPNLINEAKAGIARTRVSTGGPVPGQELVDLIGIQGLKRQPPEERAAPDIRISGFQSISWGGDNRRVANTYHLIDQLTWLKGRHAVKAGFEYRPLQYNGPARPGFGRYDFTSRHTGHAYADFVLGLPTTTQREQERPLLYSRFHDASAFLQDDFKVSPRLTLNLGLRYDYNSPQVDKFDIISTFDRATGSLVVPARPALNYIHPLFPKEVPILIGTEVGYPRALRDPDRNNFNPRVGFAFRPWANTRTVIRGGYGVFIDELTADLFAAFLVRHGPFNFNEGFTNAIQAGVPLLTFERPFLAMGARLGTLDVRGMERNLRNPYVQQWNFTVERQLPLHAGLRLSYIGTKSTRVTYRRDINQPWPSVQPFSQSRRPYPLYRQILFCESAGNQIYHALSMNLERKMQGGLYFQGAYTLAKNLTDTEDASEGGPTLENAYNRSGWRGDSRYVPRHRFFSNVIWELPLGMGRRLLNRRGPLDWILGRWQISGTYVAQTGEYFTPVFSGADPSNTNTFGGVADRLRDGNLSGSERSIDRWFDASAFAAPPNGRFGNAGRGILIGPGRQSLSLGLFKSFRIAEHSAVRVQGTATNALNHPNFGSPNLDISVPAAVGRIRSIQSRDFGGRREVMLGVRYEF
ncbi:MAG: TonB-dependent receptor [Acidobacteriota bacterium]